MESALGHVVKPIYRATILDEMMEGSNASLDLLCKMVPLVRLMDPGVSAKKFLSICEYRFATLTSKIDSWSRQVTQQWDVSRPTFWEKWCFS